MIGHRCHDRTGRRHRIGKLVGGSHTVRAAGTRDNLTVDVAPVPDPQAYANRIDFGAVTGVWPKTSRMACASMRSSATVLKP